MTIYLMSDREGILLLHIQRSELYVSLRGNRHVRRIREIELQRQELPYEPFKGDKF